MPFFAVHKKFPFSQTKSFFAESFTNCPQKPPFLRIKSLLFAQNLSELPPKTTLFHPPPPISTSLNLLFAKNTAVLLISALIPYAVKPEPRTDSKPLRRRFVGKTGFVTCCRKFLQNHFRQSFESRSQDGVPRAFWLLFARCKK